MVKVCRKRILALVLVVATLMLTGAAFGDPLYPTDDTYVRQAEPTDNRGDYNRMRLRDSVTHQCDAYLRFDLTGITGTVTNATLRLYTEDAFENIKVAQVSSTAWGEMRLTWSNRGSLAVTSPSIIDCDGINCPVGMCDDYCDGDGIPMGSTVDLTVTDAVSATTGECYITFILISDEPLGLKQIYSKESNYSPELIITTE